MAAEESERGDLFVFNSVFTWIPPLEGQKVNECQNADTISASKCNAPKM